MPSKARHWQTHDLLRRSADRRGPSDVVVLSADGLCHASGEGVRTVPLIDQEYAELTAKALRNQQVWSVAKVTGCTLCAATLTEIAREGGIIDGVTVADAAVETFIIVWYRYE